MYHEKMSCENDIWSCCNVALGESIPKDFSDYNGIILTGSHYNCRKREVYFPWYENVIELIKTVDINGYPNLFGGCFGHNLIALALGGTVGFNPKKKYVLQIETLQTNELYQSFYQDLCQDLCQNLVQSTPTVLDITSSVTVPISVPVPGRSSSTVRVPGHSSSTVPVPGRSSSTVRVPGHSSSTVPVPGRSSSTVRVPGRSSSTVRVPGHSSSTVRVPGHSSSTVHVRSLDYSVISTHEDCVIDLPPTASLLGSTENNKNHFYIAGSNQNILALQSHPEFNLQYAVMERIWLGVVMKRKLLSTEECSFSLKTFENYDDTDSNELCEIISKFLHK